ncbi:hypothetical protein KsCSTR_10120 [Candidatus Kuenenia stuttgartiensis]|uniref:Uncharacterized protein n=1 Tax=Kuenenia stuttgartiensis TaxID=174633 RepID=Q1PYT8_KUEST|nr:hypothetical protein KsCSTR_10120 [Candidatus Kuenenia stuttgartiensis]CAJ72246.1 unknown protein [Candidatus Kuenenia stuttgartiensis]CAJ72247.1 unknown protein [Candidatus Kuenenia stuttgartiensis]
MIWHYKKDCFGKDPRNDKFCNIVLFCKPLDPLLSMLIYSSFKIVRNPLCRVRYYFYSSLCKRSIIYPLQSP